MGKCIIFCAAGFDSLAQPIEKDDYIIAADGGLTHTQNLGITPDVILGDFDSLGYAPAGSQVFPVEKDDTDAMLAVRHGLAAGYKEFLLYGSLDGKRLDHTVANFQTLQFLADRGAKGYLVGIDHIVTVIKEDVITFPAHFDGILSVFCLGPDAKGATIRGAHYTLDSGTLTSGFPLGVSNHFTGQETTVSVKTGSLLLIYDRKNGIPPETNRISVCPEKK